jgi:large subunit ribosomal protein L23
MRDARDVLRRPVVSEKAYRLQESGVYTFLVATDATKPEIRQAVESVFSVRVAKVNTLRRPGKKRRNRRTGIVGHKPVTKRAVVTLVEGDRIEIFQS